MLRRCGVNGAITSMINACGGGSESSLACQVQKALEGGVVRSVGGLCKCIVPGFGMLGLGIVMGLVFIWTRFSDVTVV